MDDMFCIIDDELQNSLVALAYTLLFHGLTWVSYININCRPESPVNILDLAYSVGNEPKTIYLAFERKQFWLYH